MLERGNPSFLQTKTDWPIRPIEKPETGSGFYRTCIRGFNRYRDTIGLYKLFYMLFKAFYMLFLIPVSVSHLSMTMPLIVVCLTIVNTQ
jgi:hypothetical protein